jgi:hypothetical protein
MTALTIKKGSWGEESRSVPTGTLFIPVAQPLSRLVLHLFEPENEDSFLAWGYFNTAFEKKEYMEPYVVIKAAEEMLAKDPTLKAEFIRKLDEEKDFAKDPEKRREFFYRRHPSWDERYNLYPVLRINSMP